MAQRIGRAAVAVALLLAVVPVAPAIAAAEPTFGTPTLTATFLSGIRFHQPVELPPGVKGIDVLVRTEGSQRIEATPVAPSGSGSIDFTLPTPSGALAPNTQVAFQLRVTLADDSAVLGPVATIRYEDTRFTWKTLSGSVVRVHWVEGDQAFGRRALDIAETAVEQAAALLGVRETDPLDVFIYADRSAFYDVIGPVLQENVGGQAQPEIRTLFANIGATQLDDPWVGIVVPHELTHIVFATATDNPYHRPAHWLNEGLAVYLSAGYDSGARASVRAAVDDGSLMPLTSLTDSFPGSADRFSLAYDEAVSAIDFIVRSYGRDALVKLVRSYAGGLTDDEAFKAGIGLDVAGFQAAWLADLGAPAPSPFGPRPAPAGPLPSGWSGPAPTAGLVDGGSGPSPAGPGAPGAPALDLGRALVAAGLGVLVALVVVIAAARLTARRRGRP